MGYIELYEEWEKTQHERNMKRMFKTEKDHRWPWKLKMKDHRHNRRCHHLRHDLPSDRRNSRRGFRRKLKMQIENEIYYRMRYRDYRTYGRNL